MGNLGLVLMGGDMLSKSLTQFSVDGWGCVPSLWFGLRLNYGKGNGSNGNLLHTAPRTVLFSAHDPTAGHCPPTLHQRLLDTHRKVWLSLL